MAPPKINQNSANFYFNGNENGSYNNSSEFQINQNSKGFYFGDGSSGYNNSNEIDILALMDDYNQTLQINNNKHYDSNSFNGN